MRPRKRRIGVSLTILGDGQVIVILDSAGLLKASGVVDKAALGRDRKVEAVAEGSNKDEVPLLLFNAIDDNLKAVPLQHVARLEEIDLSDIEFAGGKRVVQYGDALMPIHLYDPRADLPSTGKRPVIVFKTKEGLSGLVVDRILDITTHRGEYQIKSEGTLEGSAIVQGKTTDIINLSFDGWKSTRSGFVPQPDTLTQPDYGSLQ